MVSRRSPCFLYSQRLAGAALLLGVLLLLGFALGASTPVGLSATLQGGCRSLCFLHSQRFGCAALLLSALLLSAPPQRAPFSALRLSTR